MKLNDNSQNLGWGGGGLQSPSFPGFYGPEIGPTHESKQVSKGYF